MKETIFLNYLFLSFLGDLSFHLETEMLNFYVFTEQQKILKNCFSRVIVLKILFSFTKSSWTLATLFYCLSFIYTIVVVLI